MSKKRDRATTNRGQNQDFDNEVIGDPYYPPNTKVTVSLSDLQPFIKSKRNLYNIIATEGKYCFFTYYQSTLLGQIYLPPFDECNLQFMKDLMKGKKKVSALYRMPLISAIVLPQ